MKYFWLNCVCSECGHVIKPRAIGTTSDHQLVIAAKCRGCKKDGKFLFPLSDLFRDCTRRNAKEVETDAEKMAGVNGRNDLTSDDKIRLKSLGVTLDDA